MRSSASLALPDAPVEMLTALHRPFLLDLDSTNGTLLNGKEVEGRRYIELMTGDTVRFGTSERDYVLLREE